MRQTRRFLRTIIAPLWRWYVAGVLLLLATNALAVRVPVELAHGLDALRAGQDGVWDAALHTALLGVAIILTRSLSRVAFFSPGRHAEFALRQQLFTHLMRLQPSFYARHTTGDLIARATSDVTFARAFAGFGLLQAVNVVVALVLCVGQMLALSPLLFFACAVPVGLAFALVQRGFGQMFTLQRQSQAQLGRLSDDLVGVIQGVGTVQAFCVEPVFADRLGAHAVALRTTNLGIARLRALVFPILGVAGGACVAVLIGLGGQEVAAGRLTVGTLAAFIGLVAYLLVPLRLLGFLFPVFQRTEASLERVYHVLDTVPERPETGRELELPHEGAGPRIEIEHLTFAYPDAPDRPVLRDLTVTLESGATIGVFGRTGSGKTALLRLLARLWNAPDGAIRVDGVPLSRVDLDTWRRRVTFVPQTAFLFSETIAENVGLGQGPDVVERAVRLAALAPDLAALPDGLRTVVGERGIVLSGGQRQRVALARGLARSADLVLLDDVLSAVDHRTEAELLANLTRPGDGRRPTRVIVSNRLSALEKADKVLVLDAGALVDVGTHAELVARPGPYRDAWLAQQAEGV